MVTYTSSWSLYCCYILYCTLYYLLLTFNLGQYPTYLKINNVSVKIKCEPAVMLWCLKYCSGFIFCLFVSRSFLFIDFCCCFSVALHTEKKIRAALYKFLYNYMTVTLKCIWKLTQLCGFNTSWQFFYVKKIKLNSELNWRSFSATHTVHYFSKVFGHFGIFF